MNKRSLYIPITFSEMFPDEITQDRLEMLALCLRQLNCRDNIFLCAQLNFHVSRAEDPKMKLQEQVPLLKLFISDDTINGILQRYSNSQVRNGYEAESTVFHRHQLLELIRYIILQDVNSSLGPLKNNLTKKQFLQAALLVNDILLESTYGHLRDMESNELRRAMLEPVRQSGMLTTNAFDFGRQIARGATLYLDYMQNIWPGFEEIFRTRTGLTLKEYFGCLFIIAGHYTLRPNQNETISKQLYCQNEHICQLMTKYMEWESYSIPEFKQAFENQVDSHPLKPLRERPILRFTEEKAIVLDPAFHTERASKGPLFLIPQSNRGQAIDAFGLAFEKYAQDILTTLCVNSGIDSFNLKKNQLLGSRSYQLGEIDAAVTILPALILFEIKGKWIRDNPRIEPDYETYLDHVIEKYGKGVRQLARTINDLINNQSQARIDGLQITDIRTVFPVLIVFDSLLTLPGHTQFFEGEFASAMANWGNFRREHRYFLQDQWQISPLIIMTIDALEWLEESTVNFQLSALLEDYANHRNQSPFETEDTSLLEYIKWSRYNDLMLGSKRMGQKTMEVFKESLISVLPAELANQVLQGHDEPTTGDN